MAAIQMDEQKSSYWKFALGFIGLLVLGAAVFVAAFWFRPKPASTPAVNHKLQPDEIVVTKLPNGDQLVENKTQGYEITVNRNFLIQKPSSPNDNGVNILTTTDVGCNLYFTKINDNPFSPEEYFKNKYGELIDEYSTTTTTIENNIATIIDVKSGGELGYSKTIYLPLGKVLYSIVAYSGKSLSASCVEQVFAMAKSIKF